MEGVQGRREKNAGSKWTEDRKKRHSEKMKEYILKKKKRTRNKELKLAYKAYFYKCVMFSICINIFQNK